jgi:hypothetical protein
MSVRDGPREHWCGIGRMTGLRNQLVDAGKS